MSEATLDGEGNAAGDTSVVGRRLSTPPAEEGHPCHAAQRQRAGGDPVVILGEGFTGAVKVMFGDVEATSPTIVDATQIQVVTPAHAAGKVAVRVDASVGVIGLLKDAFEYKL